MPITEQAIFPMALSLLDICQEKIRQLLLMKIRKQEMMCKAFISSQVRTEMDKELIKIFLKIPS